MSALPPSASTDAILDRQLILMKPKKVLWSHMHKHTLVQVQRLAFRRLPVHAFPMHLYPLRIPHITSGAVQVNCSHAYNFG